MSMCTSEDKLLLLEQGKRFEEELEMHGDFSPDLEQDKAGLVNMRRAVNFSELN